MAEDILAGLTPQQLEAVTHRDGPMLVVAGAGSGKTRVVTRRIAWLIGQGVRPHQILAMTFTNKAAGEMKERIAQLVGEAPRWIGTFHSLCAKFLRFDIDRLNEERDSRFTIYDTDDQQSVLKKIIKDLNIEDKRYNPRFFSGAISKAKCESRGPEELPGCTPADELTARVYAEYERRLRQVNAVDFDDLLGLTVRLLERLPELRDDYRKRFRYLLIDEYQDTNRTQYKLMKLLCNADHNVHVTGDPDQSIYSWRGADYRNIMDFQGDFPQAKVVRLERNYRSTGAILSAANHVIRHNSERIDKELYTEDAPGEPLHLVALASDRDEAEWIVQQAAHLKQAGAPYAGMAVFYRTNAQSRPIEEALLSAGVPYQLVGGVRFYERREIKDFLAHLKLLVNPRDTAALERVTGCRPTGVGEKTLASVLMLAARLGRPPLELLAAPDFNALYEGRATNKLRDFAGWCGRLAKIDQKPVGECIKKVLELSGLIEHLNSDTSDPTGEDRIENLYAFLARAKEFEDAHPDAALADFLEDIALVADVDAFDPDADNLVLMTLHSAKGLEFPVVFLAGLENGLLPHSNSAEEAAREEEERRLFYVGITRARRKLYITRAKSRMMWGKFDYARPSPFLSELPLDEVRIEDLSGDPDDFGGRRRGGVGWDAGCDADPGDFFGSEAGDDDDADVFGDLAGLDDEDDFPAEFLGQPKKRPAPGGSSWSAAGGGRKAAAPGRLSGDGGRVRTKIMVPAKRNDDERIVTRAALGSAATPFRSGDHVEHPTFGRGKVLSCSKSQVVVQFFSGGTRLLSLASAQLKKAQA